MRFLRYTARPSYSILDLTGLALALGTVKALDLPTSGTFLLVFGSLLVSQCISRAVTTERTDQ